MDTRHVIRRAEPRDLPQLRELASQLGYDIEEDVLEARLGHFLRRDDHAVFVGEKDGRVVGFINGGARHDLIYPTVIEMMGMVVDAGERSNGLGSELLRVFEDWARGQGLRGIMLGSREIRRDAHRFYEREGFELEKVHNVYKKRL